MSKARVTSWKEEWPFYIRVKNTIPQRWRDEQRDYVRISQSSLIARTGVLERNINTLAAGVALYYSVQLDEGMRPLPDIPNALAKKYLGGGYGGYALYLFPCRDDRDQAVKDNPAMKRVEPYCRPAVQVNPPLSCP